MSDSSFGARQAGVVMRDGVTSEHLYRARDHVYDHPDAAIADGWDGAEYGWWVPRNCNIGRATWGWLALSRDRFNR